jgi:REP element-mobilizing transposase RayT
MSFAETDPSWGRGKSCMLHAPAGRRAVATGEAQPVRRQSATRGTRTILLLAPAGRRRLPMPGTYSQLLLHIVFSTKGRKAWITSDLSERLYSYIGGIIRAEKGVLYNVGGVEDHVHLYLRWRPDGSISDLMRTVKARSSKWIHDTFPELRDFAWQEGYSVFSVSKSQEPAVKKYIASQAEHHKKEDFKSELLKLLIAHGIEFDERYVFD